MNEENKMLEKLKSEKRDLQYCLDAQGWLLQEAMGSADRVTIERQHAKRRRWLEEIQGAIKRLEREEGGYGRCAECGRRIDPDRLTILPWTTMCIECKSKGEKGRVHNHATVFYGEGEPRQPL
jgi:DnaK suppressor protein